MEDFASHSFFFDLLSLCLLLVPAFYLLPTARARRILMILAGMYLLYFIAPRLVLFNLVYWCIVYFIHRHAFSYKEKGKTLFALSLMPLVVLPLVFWKLMDFKFVYFYNLVSNLPLHFISVGLWEIDLSFKFIVPIGLSFMTFRALDLIIKTYLGKLADLSFSNVLFYGFFPPVQIVGPIIEYEEIEKIPQKAEPQDIVEGCARVAIGFIKVFILAGLLAFTAEAFKAPQEFPVWKLWAYLFGYTWYMYLNFSGYSDIAIGCSRLFGFKLKENFNFPFFSKNIQEFWNHWHMSLSRWAQRNIFIPSGGYRKETQRKALFFTMMAIALWHDINIGMALFGIYHFTALVIHRQYAAAHTKPDSIAVTRAYMLLTYIAAAITFPMLTLETAQIPAFYKSLAGL